MYQPYSTTQVGRFVFAYEGGFVDKGHKPIKPKSFHTRVSCIGYKSLKIASISNEAITSFASTYKERYSQHTQNSSYGMTSFFDSDIQADSLAMFYAYCLQSHVLLPQHAYVFAVAPFYAPYSEENQTRPSRIQHYKAFAIDMQEVQLWQTSHTNNLSKVRGNTAIYENLSSQILIPYILLPLALQECPNGVYVFDDWLCAYSEGKLIYDCVCADMEALEDSLSFVETLYGVCTETIVYFSGFLANQNRQTRQGSDSVPSKYDKHTFVPIDMSLVDLMHNFILHNAQYAEYAPLYNDKAKTLLQTQSFWSFLKICACCTLIISLPFLKLAWATHLQQRASNLESKNRQIASTLQAQKLAAERLPQQIAHITNVINTLSTIHTQYIPRLKIISLLSQVASKNAIWITDLALTSQLEQGEVLLDLKLSSAQAENLSTLIYALKNEPNFQIIEEQFVEDTKNFYSAKIVLKIFYA